MPTDFRGATKAPSRSFLPAVAGVYFDRKDACARIAARIPKLAIAQRWRDVPTNAAHIEIKSLSPQDCVPWPMVGYLRLDGVVDGDPRIGAAAFIFGKVA